MKFHNHETSYFKIQKQRRLPMKKKRVVNSEDDSDDPSEEGDQVRESKFQNNISKSCNLILHDCVPRDEKSNQKERNIRRQERRAQKKGIKSQMMMMMKKMTLTLKWKSSRGRV